MEIQRAIMSQGGKLVWGELDDGFEGSCCWELEGVGLSWWCSWWWSWRWDGGDGDVWFEELEDSFQTSRVWVWVETGLEDWSDILSWKVEASSTSTSTETNKQTNSNQPKSFSNQLSHSSLVWTVTQTCIHTVHTQSPETVTPPVTTAHIPTSHTSTDSIPHSARNNCAVVALTWHMSGTQTCCPLWSVLLFLGNLAYS